MKEQELGYFDYEGLDKGTHDDMTHLAKAILMNSQVIVDRIDTFELKVLSGSPEVFTTVIFQQDSISVNGKSFPIEYDISTIMLMLIHSKAIKLSNFCATCVIDHYCRLRKDPEAPPQVPPRDEFGNFYKRRT